jgi:transposase
VRTAKPPAAQTLYRLQAIPGIGTMLRLVLLDAIHAIPRFPRGQDCVSSCRLVTCAKAAAGKRYGTAGTQIGHASLKWAFSAAAVLFLRNHPAGQKSLARLEKKHGKGKALTVLAHKLARAVYYMLQREVVCDLNLFLQSEGRGAGEPAAALGHDGRAWQPCSAIMPPVRRRTPMSP